MSKPVLVPILQHLSGTSLEPSIRSEFVTVYFDPTVKLYNFAMPFDLEFNYNAESLSHIRNLKFLKPLLGGPYFDLEGIWDEYTHYEFTYRSVEYTIITMV